MRRSDFAEVPEARKALKQFRYDLQDATGRLTGREGPTRRPMEDATASNGGVNVASSGPDAGDYQYEGNWLTAAYCQERFGLSVASLSRWAREGCPVLEGRLLRRKSVPEAGNQKCFHRLDIEDITTAKAGDD